MWGCVGKCFESCKEGNRWECYLSTLPPRQLGGSPPPMSFGDLHRDPLLPLVPEIPSMWGFLCFVSNPGIKGMSDLYVGQ